MTNQTTNGSHDEDILKEVEGEIQEQGPALPQQNFSAGADSCMILFRTLRQTIGISDPIPHDIEESWKTAYIAVAEKYQFDLLGSWGPELSLLGASYYLYLDTMAKLPERELEKTANVNWKVSPTDESNRDG